MEKEHLEIILEDIQGKFELVLEGHGGLRQEIRGVRKDLKEHKDYMIFLINTLSGRVDSLETNLIGKIDTLAADLAAHRADTEVHKKSYRVSED